MSRNRSLINMISGGIGYLVPITVNLVTTPILIRSLGEAAFGIQSLFNVIIGYFMVADMGLDIPITKFVAENNTNNDIEGNNTLLTTTLQIYFAIGCFGLISLYMLSELFSKKLFSVPDELINEATNVFKLAGIGFFASTMNMWGRATLNGYHRYDLTNGINTINGLLGTLSGVGFVYFGYGVTSFVMCKIFFSCISMILYIAFIKNKVSSFKIKLGIHKNVWDKIKSYLGYGLVVRVSGVILGKMDQTLLGIWMGVAIAGLYSIPFLIPSTISYFTASIFTFIFPIVCEFHSQNKQNELKDLFLNYSRLLAIITSAIFFPLLLFGDKFMFLWMGDEISGQTRVLFFILSLGFFITILFITISNLFVIGIGKMRIFTQFTIIKGSVIVAGLVIFIRPYGLNGAGAAILFSSICDLLFFILTFKYFLSIKTKQIASIYFKPIMAGIILCGVFFFTRPYITNWLLFILINSTFLLFYIIIIYKFKLINEKEKTFIWKYFEKIKGR